MACPPYGVQRWARQSTESPPRVSALRARCIPRTGADVRNRRGLHPLGGMGPDFGLFPDARLRHYVQGDEDGPMEAPPTGRALLGFRDAARRWRRHRRPRRKDYLPLFCRLTAAHGGAKTVLYNSGQCPSMPPGFRTMRFETRTRTNWHYAAAAALAAGALPV